MYNNHTVHVLFHVIAKFCAVTWDKSELQSLVPMEVKNKKLSLPVRITVNVPLSQRIGPSKIDESHVHRSVLRRRQSKPKREHSAIPKSNTLSIPSRRSAENDGSESSKTPSPLSSPSRMKKFSGSLRRSIKSDNEPKPPVVDNESELLQSLDLQSGVSSKSKEHDINTVNDVPSVLSPNDAVLKNKIGIKDTVGGTPKASRSTFRRSFAKLKHLKSTHSDSNNTDRPGSSKSTTTTTVSKPIPINNPRLMDTLNLDYPLANDLRIDSKNRDSTLSDNTTDTISDTVDFDSLSGDRVSITSDPGSLLIAPGRIGTLPAFKKSSTMSLNQKRSVGYDDSAKKSIKPFATQRKRVLTPVQSLPMGNPLKPMFTPGLPVLNSPVKTIKAALQKKQLKMDFLLQYTGGEGAKEGYYREVLVDLHVSVRPALYFFDFSVIPVKG